MDEGNTKNCVMQSLLKNQKVIQNAANPKIYNANTKMHIDSKIIHPSLYFELNVASPVIKYISALNCYQTIQKKSSKITKFYQQKSSMSTLTRITILKTRLSKHQK